MHLDWFVLEKCKYAGTAKVSKTAIMWNLRISRTPYAIIIKVKLCSAHIHCAQKPLETANNFADNQKLLLIIKIGNRSNAADT